MNIKTLISFDTVQVMLPILAFFLSFATMYFNANIITELYNEQTAVRRKLLFALITGPGFSVFPIYLAYLLGGSVKLNPAVYLIFRNVNPVFALLYCVLSLKILKLTLIRSFRLMNISFLTLIVQKNLSMFVGAAFFGQPDSISYDIYKDFSLQFVSLILLVIVHYMIIIFIRRGKYILKITDSLFANYAKETAVYVLRSSSVYLVCILLPLYMPEKALAYFLIVVLTTLAIIICILSDIKKSLEVELDNISAHISSSGEAIENFRAVKHDFYNILQTYGGYLTLGNLESLKKYHSQLVGMTSAAGSALELSQRVEENPVLFSLLINKSAYAEKLNVHLNITLPPKLPNLHIEMIDLCRALACLLDNAIESAAESLIHKVQFTLTEKAKSSALIIISNYTKEAVDTTEILKKGTSSKYGHTGIGLGTVRKTLGKYGNCGFHVNYYDNEFVSYIELKPAK